MRNRLLRLALPAALAACPLSGCVSAPADDAPAPSPPADAPTLACEAGQADWATGQTADAGLVARVQADTHSRSARVLHPGQVVTMEFNAQRVNVHVDAANRVTRITCG